MGNLVDGSMAKPERQESLRLIRENKKVNIILVSFKAGSTGRSISLVFGSDFNLTVIQA
jgi:hypothetical protein